MSIQKRISSYSLLVLFAIFTIQCKGESCSNEIKASDIIKQLSNGEIISYKGKTIIDDLDFSSINNGIIESNNLNRVYIPTAISFVNCTFKGKVLGFHQDDKRRIYSCAFQQAVSFLGCSFTEEFNFRDCTISGTFNLSQSTFNNIFNIEGLFVMGGDAFLSSAIFTNTAKMNRARFSGNFMAMDAHFYKMVLFQNAKIDLLLNFGNAIFEEYTDLSGLKADGILLNYVECKERLNLNNSTIHSRFDMSDCKIKDNFNLSSSLILTNANIKRSVFDKNIDFSNSVFLNQPDFTESTFTEIIQKNSTMIKQESINIK